MHPDGVEILELAEADGSMTPVVILGMVEDEQGSLAVTCPAAALDGDPNVPMTLRVLQVHEKKKRLQLRDEPDPERAAWAVAVAEEALLEG